MEAIFDRVMAAIGHPVKAPVGPPPEIPATTYRWVVKRERSPGIWAVVGDHCTRDDAHADMAAMQRRHPAAILAVTIARVSDGRCDLGRLVP